MFADRDSRSSRNVVQRAEADKPETARPKPPVRSNAHFSKPVKSCNRKHMDAVRTLIREEQSSRLRASHYGHAAFTLIELILIIVISALLVAVLLPALLRQRTFATRTVCVNNEKQIALALIIYASECKDLLPDNSQAGLSASWLWDVPWKPGKVLETNSATWQTWYCPLSGLSQWEKFRLWNYSPGNYHVVGYAMTFAGTASLASSNWNPKTFPQPITSFGIRPTPPPLTVLLADLTISQPGQINEANRAANAYVNIRGGFSRSFRTSHLKGPIPLGGNVAMSDGHVEWRKFDQMHVRTIGTTSPVFWW